MTYTAKATTSGNSKALRFDGALFRAHPEFASGRFVAHVLGPGSMLVTAVKHPAERDAETDPVLEAYLAFLETQMKQHPEHIRPLTTDDLRGLDTLLANVVINRDQDLGHDFLLP